MTVPIATSPGRSGFGPALSLSYDSGHGNGPFGYGWTLALPAVTRRTDKGLPRYDDTDVFPLSDAEDLVPALAPSDVDGAWVPIASARPPYAEEYRVEQYRPRTEGLFARIERWTRLDDGDVHWRSVTPGQRHPPVRAVVPELRLAGQRGQLRVPRGQRRGRGPGPGPRATPHPATAGHEPVPQADPVRKPDLAAGRPDAVSQWRLELPTDDHPLAALSVTLREEHHRFWARRTEGLVLRSVELFASAGDGDLRTGLLTGTLPPAIGPLTLYLDENSISDLRLAIGWGGDGA